MTENDVMETARKLAGIIRETEVYKEYLQQREVLKKQPQLYAQVNEYRLFALERSFPFSAILL